jgi:isoleucyl-tRNA synthetase
MAKSKIPEVNPRAHFSAMEDMINEYWKENEIFKKSVESRPKDKRYSFIDGPPFVSGMPHYGHI